MHAVHYGVYGARKVWLQLNREGVPVARWATFYHLSFHELTQLLGTAVSDEPPAEVAARAERAPRWAGLATKGTLATQDSWTRSRPNPATGTD